MTLNSLKGRNVIVYTTVMSTDQYDGVMRQLQNFYKGVYLGSDKEYYYLDKLGTKKPNVAVKRSNVVSIQDYEAFLVEASENGLTGETSKEQLN